MSSPKSVIRRKAAKAVVTHTAHGALAKVRRRPARAASLLTAGALVGAAVGFLLGRRTAPSPAPAPASTVAPTPVRDATPPAGPAVTPIGSAAV